MSALSTLNNAGVWVSIERPDKVKLTGLGKLTAEQKSQIIEYTRNHKKAILAALSQNGEPGQCESCPAAGYWDHSLYAGQGLLCFHRAYFECKSGQPMPCKVARLDCPRNELPSTPSGRR